MKRIIFYHFIFLLISGIFACNNEETNGEMNENSNIEKTTINKELIGSKDSAIVLADSIMYITDVINTDPAEAYYMDQWLNSVKIDILAEQLFNAVYNERLKAYDYISGEELTIQEVKEMDSEWNRDDIGQILFTEDWYFNEKTLQMYKQVNSIMLAYFRYSDDGILVGNKAGIRVYLNNTKPMRGAQDY